MSRNWKVKLVLVPLSLALCLATIGFQTASAGGGTSGYLLVTNALQQLRTTDGLHIVEGYRLEIKSPNLRHPYRNRWIVEESILARETERVRSPFLGKVVAYIRFPIFRVSHSDAQFEGIKPLVPKKDSHLTTEHVVRMGRREAFRVGQSLKWQCAAVVTAPSGVTNPRLGGFLKLSQYDSDVNTGPVAFRGQPAWRVVASGHERIVLGTSDTVTGNGKTKVTHTYGRLITTTVFKISRVTGQVLGISEVALIPNINSLSSGGSRFKESGRIAYWERFSDYGKHVQVKLPPACAA